MSSYLKQENRKKSNKKQTSTNPSYDGHHKRQNSLLSGVAINQSLAETQSGVEQSSDGSDDDSDPEKVSVRNQTKDEIF